MSLQSSLKTALADSETPLWLFTVQSGTTDEINVSNQGVMAVTGTDDLFTGRVLSWGKLSRSISDDRSGAFPNIETRVTLDDTDKAWSQLVEGEHADSIRGWTALIRLASPTVTTSDWQTEFSGVISDWGWPSPFVFEFVMRPDDEKISSLAPAEGWKITRGNWPNAHDDAVDEFPNAIYGYHVPETTGAIKCPLVDVTGTKKHLVCAGYLKSVERVYVDEVAVTTATAGTETVGGRVYTTLTWSADPGDGDVTVDAIGYEVTGDGTGDTITNPTKQIRHFLNNFVFAEWKTGNWNSDATQIDTTAFDALETYCDNHLYRGATVIASQTEGRDVLQDWARSFEFRLYWTNTSKIAVGVEDPTDATIYPSNPINHQGDILSWAMPRQGREPVTSLEVRYDLNSATGAFGTVLEISEPTRTLVRESVELGWATSTTSTST